MLLKDTPSFGSLLASNPSPCSGPAPPPHLCLILPLSPSSMTRLPQCQTGVTGEQGKEDLGGCMGVLVP